MRGATPTDARPPLLPLHLPPLLPPLLPTRGAPGTSAHVPPVGGGSKSRVVGAGLATDSRSLAPSAPCRAAIRSKACRRPPGATRRIAGTQVPSWTSTPDVGFVFNCCGDQQKGRRSRAESRPRAWGDACYASTISREGGCFLIFRRQCSLFHTCPCLGTAKMRCWQLALAGVILGARTEASPHAS